MIFFLLASGTAAQNVTTQHNDIARTGAYTSETVLTPSNVNASNFGKVFYYMLDGYVYTQPLYMANVTMGAGTAQAGTKHNVVFVATEHDSVYALDADGNLGANGKPLWHVTLLDSAHGAAAGATPGLPTDVGSTDIVPEIGVTGTPVIDPGTNTMYLVSQSKENGAYVQRLHALDITTGAEKFGGPVVLTASVAGNGQSSVNGMVPFDPRCENQRAGLLLLNGIVYMGFAAHYGCGKWHGWVLAYSAATLKQTGAWSASPNGFGASLWESGMGLAASVPDPVGNPYGYLYGATGNGTIDPAVPYTNSMDYAISVIKLNLANGAPTILDDFTPFDAVSLNGSDKDQGSSGPIVLPDSVGGGKHLFVQAGKSGRIYLLDQNNLGGYSPGNTSDPQAKAFVNEVFGNPAYWNGNIYFGAMNDKLKAFSITNGVLSSTPTSTSLETSGFPGLSSSVSSNGTSNGIVWSLRTDAYGTPGPAILYAHDARNVANLLYSSSQNAPRDSAGNAVKFATPTVANGRVYVGGQYNLSIYGELNGATQAAQPVITPTGQSFHPSLQVTITDSTPNTQIFYTMDGSMPSTASTLYTGAFTISSSQTIKAIAVGSGILASTVASETYTLITQVPTPTFNPAPGDYSSPQSVTITTTWAGATIYYTTDGSTPTAASNRYTGPVSIKASETLKAIATAPNLNNSSVAGGLYTIISNASNSIDFGSGFTSSGMVLVGKTSLSGTRLRLTNGGTYQASASWYPTQVNAQSFSTDFDFQLTPGSTTLLADGFTFAMQGDGTSQLGAYGGGLGYGPSTPGGTPGIPKSVAVKFDLYSNAGEGNNSTGLYTNGASPTAPAITVGGGVNLHNGDIFHVHMTYDGTTLIITITDTANSAATFTTSWPINIPNTVGGNTAYVGFTAGTGRYVAIQDILDWTYVSNNSGLPAASTPVITPSSGTFSSPQTVTITDATAGSTIYYTLDGSQPTTSSTKYAGAFTVSTTTTVKAVATAPNFTQSNTATSVITIQSGGTTTINFGSGFTATGLSFNGHTKLNGTRLRLTDGGQFEASSAWFATPVNVQSFTTDFSFQLTNPNADGMTFTIQNVGTAALGLAGGGLGYASSSCGSKSGILTSVAIKFDLFQNCQEGTNSTGLYTDGASPTSPAVTLGGGINLHSGDIFHVHLTYNGATLTMTITDTVTSATFTTSWSINIPATVGASAAFVGFTAGTGGQTATQEIITWTYGP
jgi:Chitobiase/beta-hexosaminidase C-terminal domain/Legume lectin domain/Fn3 associated